MTTATETAPVYVKAVCLGNFEDVRDKANPVQRHEGDIITVGPQLRIDDWVTQGVIKVLSETAAPDYPWGDAAGRAYPITPYKERRPQRVIACLNAWMDGPALARTVPSWAPHVDGVIWVDGPYVGVPGMAGCSNDESHAVMAEAFSTQVFSDTVVNSDRPLYYVAPPKETGRWIDQCEKRNAYLQHHALQDGDWLFIVDADEYVDHGELLRELPYCDVGWVRIDNEPLYKRRYDQPRILRWTPALRYNKRHHWIYEGDSLLTTHQYAGTGRRHACVPVTIQHIRDLGRPTWRRQAKTVHRIHQMKHEDDTVEVNATVDKFTGARECLRVLHIGLFDPGMVMSRLSAAINTTTPHDSVVGFYDDDEHNPLHGPCQYEMKKDRPTLKQALMSCDIIHNHVVYEPLMMLGLPSGKTVIMHHHGTHYRQAAAQKNALDKVRAHVRLVSNLELLTYGMDLHYLPNPIPCAEYMALADEQNMQWGDSPFRIAHSPSKRALKGTDVFIEVCEELNAAGIQPQIEVVMMEAIPFSQAVRAKASCHACFDSFFLGMQCSGLECGAMLMPVIAGDEQVRERARELYGYVPYTYANDKHALRTAIAALVTDEAFYNAEAVRTNFHIVKHHDYAAVALQYLNILDECTNWRQRAVV